MSNKIENTGGISFTGLLTVLFIGLKLTGYIDWSWWWVFSPIWITVSIVLGIAVIWVIGATIYDVFKK